MISMSSKNNECTLPNMELVIDGKVFSFLVDTGATYSSISGQKYSGPVSAKTTRSVGIDGVPILCPITHLLPVRPATKPELQLLHCFTIIPNTLFNLLGMEIVFIDSNVSLFFPSALLLSTEMQPQPRDFLPTEQLEQTEKPENSPDLSRVNPALWAAHKDEAM